MAILIRYTDPAQIGNPVIALILDESGNIWDNVTETFTSPPRIANHEIALTEQAPNFPGLHQASVNVPSATAGLLLVRFEESGDINRVPIGTASTTATGSSIDPTDFLNAIVPNTDTGSGDITVGQLLEEVLAIGKGRRVVDRLGSIITYYHLDDSVLRTLNLIVTSAEASQNPP